MGKLKFHPPSLFGIPKNLFHNPLMLSLTTTSGSTSQWQSLGRRSFIHTTTKLLRILVRNKSSSIVVTSIFPDASASAAGVRTRTILQQLLAKNNNDDNHVCLTTANEADLSSSAAEKLRSQIPNLSIAHLPRNRSNEVKDLVKKLQQQQKDSSSCEIRRVIWDRFYVEEAYSHAFMGNFMDDTTPLILDMQDMHSLRSGRQELVQSLDRQFTDNAEDPLQLVFPNVMEYIVPHDNDKLLRELASIHRSDLTLVCSPYEHDLLTREYQIPPQKLCLASFFINPSDIAEQKRAQTVAAAAATAETKFIFCGGFQHAPNVDAVRILIKYIWPKMQQRLESSKRRKASLHIHGAYCPQEFTQAHNPRLGIHIHGYTPNLQDVFENSNNRNILLAPLRYGAGIKGKILDAWMHGMPVITTPIGSEGIVTDEIDFGGAICTSTNEICEQAIMMMQGTTHAEDNYYHQGQKRGYQLLQEQFDQETNWKMVQSKLDDGEGNLQERRQNDLTRSLLWHQSMKSTKYLSKWIELKEEITEKEKTKGGGNDRA